MVGNLDEVYSVMLSYMLITLKFVAFAYLLMLPSIFVLNLKAKGSFADGLIPFRNVVVLCNKLRFRWNTAVALGICAVTCMAYTAVTLKNMGIASGIVSGIILLIRCSLSVAVMSFL